MRLLLLSTYQTNIWVSFHHLIYRKAGAVDNGKPGEREYVKGYYAAFVLDPLGNNIELVYWNPWWLRLLKVSPVILSGLFGAGAMFVTMIYFVSRT